MQQSTMNYSCTYCSSKFQDLDKYLSHLLKHKNLPNFVYKCPFCLISYTNNNSFRSHMNRLHINKSTSDSELSVFICLACKFDLLVGIRIKHIFFENNSINPIFVGPKEIYKYASHLNCYIFDSLSDNFNYISFKELKTEKCLIKYKDLISDRLFAIIHHF